MNAQPRNIRLSWSFLKGIVLLLVGWPSIFAGPKILQECQGCHTASRLQHEGDIALGFHRWRDDQCYGCHQELKKAIDEGPESQRYWATPLDVEKKERVAQHGFSYLNAPLLIRTCVDGVPRIESNDFFNWLKHPTSRREGQHASQQMPAFPRLTAQEQADLQTAYFATPCSGNIREGGSGSIQEGRALFEKKCAACHNERHPLHLNPQRLSLYSWQWLWAYSTQGKQPQQSARTMPRVSLTQDEAQAIKGYLRNKRDLSIARVDASGQRLPKVSERIKPLQRDEVPEFWQSFFRKGHCVHCHSGNQRAATRFQVSEAGVKQYLAKNGIEALRQRLIARPYEIEQGIVGSQPGMPMSKQPLDSGMMQMFERWVASSCYGQTGELLCRDQTKIP